MKNEGIEIFSPEERNEITARIEKASARDPIAPPGLPSKKETSRRGLFPLLVNAGALVLLTAGIALLFALQQTDVAEIRTSSANLGVTERALIREIRLENLSAQSREEIENARSELAKLSTEAEKTSLIEKQLSGFYAYIFRQIEARQYREAADSIAALREYLATPSFGSLKVIEARKESDAAAINVLSFLLEEAEKAGASGASIQIETPPPVPPGDGAEEALRQQVTQQAASIAEQNAALASMEKTLAELQKSITDLQDRNDTFTQTIEEKDKQIEALQKTISNVSSALENQQ